MNAPARGGRSRGEVRCYRCGVHTNTKPASADVCVHKLSEWRRQGTNVTVIDLHRAYLQVHVHESLWPFQTVIFRGQRYCLTRLGFGLNVAPTITKAVLAKVLSQNDTILWATSPYLDDIFVNEDVASAQQVECHYATFLSLGSRASLQNLIGGIVGTFGSLLARRLSMFTRR